MLERPHTPTDSATGRSPAVKRSTSGVSSAAARSVSRSDPSRTAFVQMTTTPEYAEIAVHRAAGLEGQLNIETVRGAIPPARG